MFSLNAIQYYLFIDQIDSAETFFLRVMLFEMV